MTEQNLAIHYDYAHLWLTPDEDFLPDDWREDSRGGKLSSAGTLDLLVGEKYFLQMQGISIPISSMGLITKHEEVVKAVCDLVGDCSGGLDRCAALVKQRALQDTLYFTPAGLSDYTHGLNSPNGDRVSSWIEYASSVKGDLKDYFPRDFSFPTGCQIKFVPTFEKLRGMKEIIREGSTGLCAFTGKTFAERIDNLLGAYDAAIAHEVWDKTEERRLRNSGRDKDISLSERDFDSKIAEVIIP